MFSASHKRSQEKPETIKTALILFNYTPEIVYAPWNLFVTYD